ncbi:MAG: TylF/MycF/NovP-related O-methyltransferase, partial [Thermoflexibacteraceae bacterium]
DSMIGLKRMENIEYCIKTILQDGIKGDMIETGVWRGGATIFMRAMLKAYNVTDRTVWVADSFEGLPKPNEEKYAVDKGDKHHLMNELAISIETVKNNFLKYNLLDDNVQFLKGWFKDTLPQAPIKELSLLRLDGDMYESTMDALNNLYHKVSKGGFIIVDDYGAISSCKQAIIDYREQHKITDPIHVIDWAGIYWRKSN